MKNLLPDMPAIIRESLIVLAGAIIAAAVIGQIPSLREWIKDQWDGAPRF